MAFIGCLSFTAIKDRLQVKIILRMIFLKIIVKTILHGKIKLDDEENSID